MKLKLLSAFGLLLLALVLPSSALAVPANDDFASATIIDPAVLPFSDTVDTTGATTEPGEPQSCALIDQSVWYSFTPTTTTMVAANVSAGIGASLNVYRQTGSGFGGLSFVGCAINPTFQGVIFTAQAGTTYYFQAGGDYGSVGNVQVTLQQIPPPANDNFADATSIGSLPFSATVDSTAATTEAGEPAPSCGFGAATGTVWYAFTPSVGESVTATGTDPFFSTAVAAYSGSSLGTLTSLGCRAFGNALTIHVDPGTTYYFQEGGLFGGQAPSLTFNLAVAPPPTVQFGFFPSDPSIFDTVQFNDFSFDPGGAGIQSESWSFGDGATATGCCPTHRYAADADYTVKLTVTTADGRSGSTSQVVHVKTHDVAIAKLVVPQSASAGQTRTITVGLSNKRYPETVQVQLLKSGAGGVFVPVGTLTQSVPVRSGNRTTDFSFSYTFTSDDAAIGKVTFQAVATIVNARDALPADNTATALPTKVNG
jgi:PKD domain-containing protein